MDIGGTGQRSGMQRRGGLACGALLLALLQACAATRPAPVPAGPPMWVARDQDSTLYLFGTVHLLDPSINWRTERVLGALEEAKQLWVEVDIPPGGEVALGVAMLQKALAPGQPLSGRLTEAERARLKTLLDRTPNGTALAAILDMARPWFATVTLGVAPLMSAGYDPEAGADKVLVTLAREQGDEIRGLETAEQQMEFLSSGTDAEQLAALQQLLAIPDAGFDTMTKQLDESVRAWMNGDIGPMTGYVESWRNGEDPTAGGMSYDLMLTRRNEDWAAQLAGLLAGEGVAFVAVGSGHLVGPDSLQEKLAARGISVARY